MISTKQTARPGYLLALIIFILATATGRAQQRVTAIVGGMLIDGTGAAAKPNTNIILSGERIAQIGPAASTPVPAVANVIHAEGKYVLPGFIDAHVHYRDYYPELLITHGITSAADWGGSPLEWELAQREGVKAGKIYGPRLYTSGEVIGGSEAEKTQVDVALKHVRALTAAGVNKIDMEFDIEPEVATAVIREAHKLGLPVSGYPVHSREAIEEGIDAIKHTYSVGSANITDLDRLKELYRQSHLPERTRDARKFLITEDYSGLIKLMVAKKVAWVPTFIKDFKLLQDRREEFELENFRLLANPELQYVPVANLILQVTNEHETGRPLVASGLVGTLNRGSADYELYRKGYKNLQGLIRGLVQAGGHVLAGTAPHSFVMPGLSLHQEMQLFVDAGLTPTQALQSASLWVAEYLRVQKDIGSVEPGKLADIVILSKNPLADIRNSRTVETVIQGGRKLPTGFHHWYVNPIPRITNMNAPGQGVGRPQVERLSPEAANEGSPDQTIQLRGKNFAEDATVVFDGVPVPTEFVSETQLKARIPEQLLRNVGSYAVQVINPRPGGGDSAPVQFIVRYQ